MSFDPTWLTATLPLSVVVFGALIVLVFEAFARRPAAEAGRGFLAIVTLLFLGLALGLEVQAWSGAETARLLYHNVLVVDRFSTFLGAIFCLAAALSVMLSPGFLREHRFDSGEHYALILLSTAGMMIMAHAADLVALFIGLETMSLAVYVLCGSWRRSALSSEAAMKYFLVGAFASAVMLYGMALVYGTSGTTSLADLAQIGRGRVSATVTGDPVFLIGVFFIIGGLAFKIAAAPFHMWAPDAYEGAPTPVTAFMASGVKAAAFGVLVRFFGTALMRPELAFSDHGWAPIAAALAVLTMTVGNLMALRQENVKRMLAYSSIAHAGYLLVGVAAMGGLAAEARGAILYYLLAYVVTTVGSFGVVAWLGSQGDERLRLDDWAGLGSRHPAAALAMTIFILSLAGIPPTAGFFAKFYVFRVALTKAGLGWLVIAAVANSLVSAAYYLRVVSTMYFREVGHEPSPQRSPSTTAALIISALATLLLGLVPGWLVELAGQASMYRP